MGDPHWTNKRVVHNFIAGNPIFPSTHTLTILPDRRTWRSSLAPFTPPLPPAPLSTVKRPSSESRPDPA